MCGKHGMHEELWQMSLGMGDRREGTVHLILFLGPLILKLGHY